MSDLYLTYIPVHVLTPIFIVKTYVAVPVMCVQLPPSEHYVIINVVMYIDCGQLGMED